VVIGSIYRGTAADRCGALQPGDTLVAINGRSIEQAVAEADAAARPRPSKSHHMSHTSAAPGHTEMAPRAASAASARDGRHPLAKAALLRARWTLLGEQGTFGWLTFRRRSVYPPEIKADYLPTFAPHILFEKKDEPGLKDLRTSESVWEYQVRLLRGDSQYVASVLALDWKLDKEEQELTALDIANRKMLLLKLLDASQAGKEEQVQELVLHGADVTGTNDAEATPLHLAAFHGHNSTVAMLLANRANVNAGDGLQASALHKAARGGHIQVVQTLLDFGADVNHVDIWESTAMHWATVEGKLDVVELLAASGTDVGQKTTDGITCSDLISAEMCAGFRYSQPLVVSVTQVAASFVTLGPPLRTSVPGSDAEDVVDQGGESESASAKKAREEEEERERTRVDREIEEERKRAREEERCKDMQRLQEQEKQRQRNLLAAAGM